MSINQRRQEKEEEFSSSSFSLSFLVHPSSPPPHLGSPPPPLPPPPVPPTRRMKKGDSTLFFFLYLLFHRAFVVGRRCRRPWLARKMKTILRKKKKGAGGSFPPSLPPTLNLLFSRFSLERGDVKDEWRFLFLCKFAISPKRDAKTEICSILDSTTQPTIRSSQGQRNHIGCCFFFSLLPSSIHCHPCRPWLLTPLSCQWHHLATKVSRRGKGKKKRRRD